jgi:serralysin
MSIEGGCACCGSANCEKVDQQTGQGDNQTGPAFLGDLVPDDTTSTTPLPFGTYVGGIIDSAGDRDYYRISVVAGQRYTFSTSDSQFISTGDVGDTIIRLVNSAGTQLAINDDEGNGYLYSTLEYTATTTGFIWLDVHAYSGTATGTYRVTGATSLLGVGDTVAGDTTTAATIAVGGSVSGTVNSLGDHDWYAVTLTAGQSYFFRTNATGAATELDTTLTLHDSSGAVVAFNDDGGGGTFSLVRLNVAITGTYYVDVRGFADEVQGAFNLSVALAPPLTVFTNDQISDQLINGYWGGPASARHFNVAPGGTLTFNVVGLTAEGQNLAREALNLWSDATGITFSEITGTAQITFDDAQTGAFATAVRSGNITTSADVNVGLDWLTSYGTTINSYAFQSYIHEIGHALGLGHGGNYNGNANYSSDALYLNDSWATTIMSYFSQTENTYFANLGFTRQYVVSPLVADIISVNAMYGTPSTTRTGDTQYGFGNTSGRAIYDAVANPSVTYAVVDNGGVDTLNYSGFSTNQRINLNAEAFSDIGGRVGNVTIARGSLIENAVGGSGNDTLYGNAAANVLTGNNGNDILLGGDGNDTLDGGAGANVLVGGNGNDTLIVSGSGNELSGGAGDDIYIVGSGSDTIVEVIGGGADEVRTSFGVLTLATNVETLTYTGGAVSFLGIGNAGDNLITGGTGRDELFGRDGNDTLTDGGGGVGNEDTLLGGLGNDIYIVTVRGDSTIELPGEGLDEVRTAFSVYGLQANIDNLTFTDNGTHGAGVGNILNNILIGGTGTDDLFGREGNDTLRGGAGAANTLLGQEGDDLYIVDAVGDSVVEFAGQGTDSVLTSLSVFTLPTNVENLAVLAGTAFTGIGNASDNSLTGSSASDFLSGLDGNDIIQGGGGGDTLLGGNGADQFRYVGNDGFDTVSGFQSGVDKFALLTAFFTPTATVAFAQGAGVFATTANSTFLYDSATGVVSYDDDGNGAGAAIQLASIGTGLTLAAGDFIFY